MYPTKQKCSRPKYTGTIKNLDCNKCKNISGWNRRNHELMNNERDDMVISFHVEMKENNNKNNKVPPNTRIRKE